MAPKSAPVGDTAYTINGVTMTASDMKLIFGILNSLTAPIEADMDAAAAFAGYTVGSFKKMWPTLKKKCNIDSVSGTKQTSSAAPAPTTAEDDSGETIATPKKTPGGGGGGRGARGRPANKKVLTEETGGPSPLTPGIPAGMKALSVADAAGSETPETPSKSIFGGGVNTSTSAKKRTAADAADADPDADLMTETPAKKKPARKPRVTAKQKREAAAAAAAAAEAEAAETTAETAAETATATSDAAAAGSNGDKNINVAMKDDHGGSDSGEI